MFDYNNNLMYVSDEELKELMTEYYNELPRAVEQVIITGDLQIFKRFVNKYKLKGIYHGCFKLPEDNIVIISVNKLAVNLPDIAEETRDKAIKWLSDHNYDLNL